MEKNLVNMECLIEMLMKEHYTMMLIPEINRKTIGATITLEDGKRVFIPLFVLGNLETYTRNPKSTIS